jgi:hypothetical protein
MPLTLNGPPVYCFLLFECNFLREMRMNCIESDESWRLSMFIVIFRNGLEKWDRAERD